MCHDVLHDPDFTKGKGDQPIHFGLPMAMVKG